MHEVVLLSWNDATAKIITSDDAPPPQDLLVFKALLDQLARRRLLMPAIKHHIQLRPASDEWVYGGMGDASSASFLETIRRLSTYSLDCHGLGERPSKIFTRAFCSYRSRQVLDSPSRWVCEILFPSDLLEFLLYRVNENRNWIADGLFPGIKLPVRPRDPGFDELIMTINNRD